MNTLNTIGNWNDFDLSQNQIDYILELQNKIAPSLSKFETINEKTLFLLELLDDINQQAFDKDTTNKVSCTKGCSHCCNIKVVTTTNEAQLVLDYCRDNNIEITNENIATLVHQSNTPDELEYMLSPYRRCIFLSNEGLCKIYPVRPSACRNYFVFSPPEKCDPDKERVTEDDKRVLTNFNLSTFAPILLLFKMSKLGNFSHRLLELINKKK